MESSPLNHQDLRTIIEKAGLRSTPQRLAVYDHLSESTEHPTAEDVYQAVRTHIPRIDLATVYKALETLVAVGVATKLNAGGGGARTGTTHAATCITIFVAYDPGTVHDLPTRFDPDLIAKLDPRLHDDLSRHGFQVTGYRLELVGYQDSPLVGTMESHPGDHDHAAVSNQEANSPARGAAK